MLLRRPGDLDRIDEAVREVEPDRVRLRIDPPPAGLVDEAPDLAEAPAKLAARIVRDVPQQLAKLAARDGVRRERQIGEERTHLARRRQRERDAVAADRQRPEQPHLRARRPRPRLGRADSTGISTPAPTLASTGGRYA